MITKTLTYINPARPYFIKMGFLLLVSRHWVSLLFPGSKYWLAFHAITHFSIMFFAIGLLLDRKLSKLDKLVLELSVLFCVYDFIDRTFFNEYTFTMWDLFVVAIALLDIYRTVKKPS